MTKVSEWSTSAGSNNSAPPDGWPENMLPGKVNDCAREMMSSLAKWYQDSNATLVTTGTGSAYALATNSGHAALSDIPLLTFQTHTANTGACTLDIDGLGGKALRKNGNQGDYAAGELANGQTLVVLYNEGTDEFEVVGPAVENPSAIPAGTSMLFVQTAAPTGWTKDVVNDNTALRLVNGTAGSGGTANFTDVFTSRTIDLTNLPSGLLDTSGITGSVGTTITNGTQVERAVSTNNNLTGGGGGNYLQSGSSVTVSLASGVVTFGGSIPLGGSDVPMDFDVAYVDVIQATKD